MTSEIVKLPEGESGLRLGNLTEERVEALVEYWGKRERDREAVIAFGKVWGLSAARVREARADKRVMARVEEQLRREALYGAVEAIAVLGEIIRDPKHKERLKAVRTQLEMAGFLKSGPQINNTNMTVQPIEYETMSDQDIAEQVERVAEERGWIRRPSSGGIPQA